MFYEPNPSPDIRFGDIIGSFVLSSCSCYTPEKSINPDSFKVDLTFFRHVAVLTPCCTIAQKGGNVLLVSPLIKVLPTFYFDNSFFREDLTRINRKMTKEEAFGPEKWSALNDSQRRENLIAGKDYSLSNTFIYENHDLLPDYLLEYKNSQSAKLNSYAIDFRHIYRIEHKKDFRGIKLLQLSISSRNDLRNKMVDFFGRCPEEDRL